MKLGWAGLILSCFNNYIKDLPTVIRDLYLIIDNEDRWAEAHEQFTKIRQFGLSNKDFQPESYLQLAEKVAKVTYNASGEPAPFDSDSCWHIPSLALQLARQFGDKRLEEEVDVTVYLFSRNKRFKENIKAASDFLLYKRIDEILWYDWDPIAINNVAPRDEYQAYVPEVYNLRKSGATRGEIAQHLHELENKKMGMDGDLERCLEIADKILQA
ncbi:hypothetical protein [Pontibacter ramchanderi]|uniref:Uncharacterized protein n=1 Tax=Pontibacter ramchanderi TaxID=1179743 RepID=A0A2N3U6L0_9BACT|nr:hypothetical protein [Pontibacter ramchanderi]PKV62388.1 hypothetical protein BD749_3896 [Pontibacter ramchanderi]